MIGIINTHFGNINAIKNIYIEHGVACKSVTNQEEVKGINKIIIPGVGNFDSIIESLKAQKLFDVLDKLVMRESMPILGICIGMHIFFESSDEGKSNGFGWLKGAIKKLDTKGMRYPHMGWNNINFVNKSSLFKGIDDKSYFYYLHSYGNTYDTDARYVSALTNYGQDIICSVESENIYGVQFHPEKSHKNGARLLVNFAKLNA